MKRLALIKVGIVGALAVWLVACSPKPPTAGAIVGDGPGGSVGANSYGAKVNNQFHTDANGMKVNPLTAPSNQTYYFSFDKDAVRSSDMEAILVQANYLVAHPQAKVRLEGNTDARGSREYNIALGWRRDQTVARVFEQQGVRPQQIDMVSYGKERPVSFGQNEHSWQLNRRVNLIYEVTQ